MNDIKRFYDAGYRAYDNNKRLCDNPATQEVNRNAWHDGYKQAELDYLEFHKYITEYYETSGSEPR